MPKLSIIIPVCNMKRQVAACLSSIRKTVRLPYEVIVIDDGSSDDQRIDIPPSGDDVRILRSDTQRGFAHAVNSGICASSGEVLLFLHADVLLAPHTAEDMLDALIESPQTGGVTAAAPRTYEWEEYRPDTEYHSWDEFAAVAESLRRGRSKQLPLIVSEMIALMVRRDVVAAAGFLDASYVVPALAAYDYTVRMTRAGYGLAVLPGVFVHHEDSIHAAEMEAYDVLRRQERRAFQEKWGISLDYSFMIRLELFPLMDLSRDGLRILEIGCACGATLREIGSRNPSVRLYGVELNADAAAVAAPYAEILSMDVEQLDPADISEQFDYIIMGDVIEHLIDPWAAVRNMRDLLAPGGAIIASIPNVAHISNLYQLLSGKWTYEEAGLLDRTHVRFFTKREMVRLFEEAGLVIDEIRFKTMNLDTAWQRIREEILSLRTVQVNPEDVDAYQWLFRVVRE